MKVSGKDVADAISKNLKKQVGKLKIKPCLAIILAGNNPASRIYVNNKIKRAQQLGIKTRLLEFSRNQFNDCLMAIQKLNEDKKIHGIIVQYPTYEDWDFDNLISKIDSGKDVDGFRNDSPYRGATALAVWEMLKAFASLEGFSSAEKFLKGKSIVLLGKGKTAGGPIRGLLEEKGIFFALIDSKTENPDKLIKNADVIISATGRKNIITGEKIKKGSFVIGVGVGKELVDQEEKIFGDIEEATVSQKAKLYCPTIGGIGPLTIVSLLENVIESARRVQSS
ncbi:MAG: bifunctional 5,10-methylenetetrahydrofolate dehydrogenase/5,10-methenyltetrahydrofolate cyclohydrolase [Candidatus Daviesbacteria bacterium]|nr:bifunctional 5,10-methylenetetrahydrofolate dehydrogenase/5,10-methenyltetrahydrofolate cyclohydrolase [Candidatus Daviesbacteria bacterium]